MPICQICNREYGVWSFGSIEVHMMPPRFPGEHEAQVRQKEWTKIEFTTPDPVSQLTKGRKKGMALRDGKKQTELF
jgi:hypothetical protein